MIEKPTEQVIHQNAIPIVTNTAFADSIEKALVATSEQALTPREINVIILHHNPQIPNAYLPEYKKLIGLDESQSITSEGLVQLIQEYSALQDLRVFLDKTDK